VPDRRVTVEVPSAVAEGVRRHVQDAEHEGFDKRLWHGRDQASGGSVRWGVLIRPATDADWASIFPFFTAIVEAGETYAYPEGLSSDEARALWLGQHRVVVAEEDGVILGSATMGPNRPGRGAHVGTASFMVDESARGRGVGRALAEHALAWSKDAGFRAIQFNAVVETNTGAVRLWRSLGFDIVGTVPEAFDSRAHGLVGLHVMHRRL
jgi:L-amino acid N-acyltransferase YncA